MEIIHGRRKASKFAPEDVISNMPDIVITNILDRLPIQDAVRTGILARHWRLKWTMLSQLVFDQNFFAYLSKTEDNNNHVRIISRILLHITGAVTKFVLSIDHLGYPVLDANDINHWILFLSRKGVKDLTLKTMDDTLLKLSTHLFSCLELRHLKLYNCCFHSPSSFHFFSNLLSLELDLIPCESTELAEFIIRCPLLESLTLGCFSTRSVKLVEIAKLENLKKLSFSLFTLDTIPSTSSIFELVGSLPKLHELHLDFLFCTLIEDGAKKSFSTAFPCLKALKVSNIYLDNDNMLSCFIEMITSFANLQTLEITTLESMSDWAPCFPKIDYNAMGLLQLLSVVFRYSKASENEVWLIKYLLASSPLLKKIVIHPHFLSPHITVSDEKFMFARKLLMLHRASPVVNIDLR